MVALELLTLGLITLYIWQTRHAVLLPAAVQHQPRQMKHLRLLHIEAAAQRLQRLLPECKDHRLLEFPLYSGSWLRGPGLHVLDHDHFPPLLHRLEIDPPFPAQLREPSVQPSNRLRRAFDWPSLYCRSDSARHLGSPATNLSHGASSHSCEKIALSNSGIKHLRALKHTPEPKWHPNDLHKWSNALAQQN
jgi:hypothetical protein